MSNPKLLIPLDYLTEACFLSPNNADKKYKMVLELAQDQLKSILGLEFYQEIETQYAPQNDTLTVANAALYEGYIKKYLAWQTYVFYIQFSQADDTPTGIREHIDENSSIISDIKLSARERNIQNKAMFYKSEMVTFLKSAQLNDSTAYPLWSCGCCGEQMSWGISGVSTNGEATRVFSVNKAIINNQ